MQITSETIKYLISRAVSRICTSCYLSVWRHTNTITYRHTHAHRVKYFKRQHDYWEVCKTAPTHGGCRGRSLGSAPKHNLALFFYFLFLFFGLCFASAVRQKFYELHFVAVGTQRRWGCRIKSSRARRSSHGFSNTHTPTQSCTELWKFDMRVGEILFSHIVGAAGPGT